MAELTGKLGGPNPNPNPNFNSNSNRNRNRNRNPNSNQAHAVHPRAHNAHGLRRRLGISRISPVYLPYISL